MLSLTVVWLIAFSLHACTPVQAPVVPTETHDTPAQPSDSARICKAMAGFVLEVAIARDTGKPEQGLFQHLEAVAKAQGKSAVFIAEEVNLVAFVYRHPEASPAQLRQSIETGCLNRNITP